MTGNGVNEEMIYSELKKIMNIFKYFLLIEFIYCRILLKVSFIVFFLNQPLKRTHVLRLTPLIQSM